MDGLKEFAKVVGGFVAFFAALLVVVLVLVKTCSNGDGDCRGTSSIAERIDAKGVPGWRDRCWEDRRTLMETVSLVPPEGKVVEILSCSAILVRLHGRCFIVTRGFRSHSWSQGTCLRAKDMLEGQDVR